MKDEKDSWMKEQARACVYAYARDHVLKTKVVFVRIDFTASLLPLFVLPLLPFFIPPSVADAPGPFSLLDGVNI